MDDSAIPCDEIIELNNEETKTNFNENKATCKTQNFYILLAFLLTNIALLTTISIVVVTVIFVIVVTVIVVIIVTVI